jgi:hypothetical protein
MFQIDSDAILAGLCAFRVAAGDHPAFFPGGTRLGAASCYLAAGYFHLFGPGRVGLALTALTWSALYLTFTLLFLQVVLGRKYACLGFLFAAVPSEQFMTVTYAPWGYGEIMASCAATLWLAALWRKEGKVWQRSCFGLSIGLGLWFSLQTLMIALPAIAWVALKRRRAMFGESFPAVLAAIAGAAPFIIANAANGFASLTANWASRPAGSLAAAWENFLWLLSSPLPKLLFHGFSAWGSPSTILLAAYVVIAAGFFVALYRRAAGDPTVPGDAVQLLAFAVAACLLIFVFSQAGSMRGWTVRYIAPLYAVVPVFCAIGVERVWRWSRALAVACVAALIVSNLLLYSLPGSSQRADLTAALQDDAQLRRLLAERGIQMVYGDYFWVYHLNFDSHERIAGIPWYAPADYFGYGSALAQTPVRWAAIGGLTEVLDWARGVGARGVMTTDGEFWVFIADRPAYAARLLAELRSLPP